MCVSVSQSWRLMLGSSVPYEPKETSQRTRRICWENSLRYLGKFFPHILKFNGLGWFHTWKSITRLMFLLQCVHLIPLDLLSHCDYASEDLNMTSPPHGLHLPIPNIDCCVSVCVNEGKWMNCFFLALSFSLKIPGKCCYFFEFFFQVPFYNLAD